MVSTPTPDTVIRYTTSGAEPTASDPEVPASGEVTIDTSSTLKARAWRPERTESQSSAATYTLQLYSGLSIPVASPASGLYLPGQAVTLTADSGTSIRYTVDGTEPSEASTLYSGAIVLGSSTTTIRARAFKVDWVPSDASSDQYRVDTAPPFITAIVSPPANPAGWHNADVTVVFVCNDLNGIAHCPPATTVTAEGSAIEVSGTAIDTMGRESIASVLLNIDRTAPDVTVLSPGVLTQTGDPNVDVTYEAADAGSGLAVEMCNGQSPAMSGECIVALRPGRNSVVVSAIDVAGNSASSAIQVRRIAVPNHISATPDTITMLIEEERVLRVVDELGDPILNTSLTWVSDTETVATVDANGEVVAIAEGTATLTATLGTMSAAVDVTVVTGTALAAGTVVWGLAPDLPLSGMSLLKADSSEFDYWVQEDASTFLGGGTLMRGIDTAGVERTRLAFDGTVLFAHAEGGFVIRTASGLARHDAPTGAVDWRFESSVEYSSVLQNPDGRIYATAADFVDVIDGASGILVRREPIPAAGYSQWVDPLNCEGGNSANPTAPSVGLPVIDGLGRYRAIVSRTTSVLGFTTTPEGWCGNVTQFFYEVVTSEFTLGEGTPSLVPFHTASTLQEQIVTSPPVVDGEGGMWVQVVQDPYGTPVSSGRYFIGGSSQATADPGISPLLVGEGGVAFGDDGSGNLASFALSSGAVSWMSTYPANPVMAPSDGGVIVLDGQGQSIRLDPAGVPGVSAALPIADPKPAYLGSWIGESGGRIVLTNSVEGFPGFEQRAVAEIPQPPTGRYRTRNAAAIAVLQYFNPLSIERNREYGGRICETVANRFVPSVPAANDGFSDTVLPSACPGQTSEAGRYHTHARFGGSGLSSQDATNAQALPSIPWFVASPCGGIYEYSQYTNPPWFQFTPQGQLYPIYGKLLSARTTTSVAVTCPAEPTP